MAQPLDDTQILSNSVVQADGEVHYTDHDGFIIIRPEPPASGREAIEWCTQVRDIVAGRENDKRDEARAWRERKEYELQHPESAPTSTSPVTVEDKPTVSTDQTSAPTPTDPLEYALEQRKSFSDAMVTAGAKLEELKEDYETFTKSWKLWNKIIHGLDPPSSEAVQPSETDAEMSNRVRRETMPVGDTLPTEDESRMDDERGS